MAQVFWTGSSGNEMQINEDKLWLHEENMNNELELKSVCAGII